MANFKQINRAIKKAFPDLKVKVFRGNSYVYFDDSNIPSLFVHPSSVTTEQLTELVIEELQEFTTQTEEKINARFI